MKRFVLTTLFCVIGPGALAHHEDTDGDGLLDLLDVHSFDPAASGTLNFRGMGIQDLDGARWLTFAEQLDLGANQLTSIERGDFQWLHNLQELRLDGNQLTSIESGAFRWGLHNLQELRLDGNQLTILTLAHARFAALRPCDPLGGFCVDGPQISELILDDALLSVGSFNVILSEIPSIKNASLFGLEFSGSNPANLNTLLAIETLHHVSLNQSLFDLYVNELNTFAAIPGNSVAIFAAGDCSRDGTIDAMDLPCQTDPTQLMQLQDQLGVLPGDFDGVNGVDFSDFLKLSAHYPSFALNYGEGDINLDSQTTFTDFLELATRFGMGITAAPVPVPVPEPGAWLLLSWGVFCLLGRSRRINPIDAGD